MNALRKKRMYAVIFLMLVSFVVGGLVISALNQNINLYFTPSEIKSGKAPLGVRIRIGGMVQKGSLKRGEHLNLEFRVSDLKEDLKVYYQGILPDLFQEGKGVVALGRLSSGGDFVADQILAKHDENYMPPELRKTLRDNPP